VRRDVRSVDARFDAPALLKIDGEIRSGVIAIEARVERGAVTFRVPPLPHA